MKILIADKFGPELPGMLAKYGEVFVENDAVVPEADVILVRSKTKVKGDYLDRAKNLKFVIRGGVGVDNIDVKTCEARHILVRNTPDASSIAVAEMTFALMLGLIRRIPAADSGTRAGEWPKKTLKGTELYGKTLGLIGMGRIATEVATRAKAFGMRILAFRRSGAPSPHAEVVGLDRLLAESDIISLHVPANEGTNELINAATIDKMKKGAILINTARGTCVNVADLVAALETGKLAGAATDVYPKEPPEADSPLLKAKNLLLAPHIASSTAENMTRIGIIADQLMTDYVAGKLR